MFTTILVILIAFICGYILHFLFSSFYKKFPPPGHALGMFQPNVDCPDCGTTAPRTRRANSLKQIYLGGWTCKKCHCEFDGFGEKRS